MKLAAPLAKVAMWLNPPDYRTLRLEGIVLRFYLLQLLFTPKRVLFVNPLILPTQIIRELLIHPLATLLELNVAGMSAATYGTGWPLVGSVGGRCVAQRAH